MGNVLKYLRWLARHPGALLGLVRGAGLRDLVLREDLRRLGFPIPIATARGLGGTRMNATLVERLARTFRELPPRTLLDVGAARGGFAAAAAIAFPGLSVFAFEPLSGEFAVLRRRFGHAFPFALGDESGTAVIHVSGNPGSSSLAPMLDRHAAAFPGTGLTGEERIEVRRLDDLVAAGEVVLAPPVLLKIDVQGTEDRVLAGAEKTLPRIDTLIVETSLVPLYDGTVLFDDLRPRIEASGLRYAGRFDEVRTASGEVLQVDAHFRRD